MDGEKGLMRCIRPFIYPPPVSLFFLFFILRIVASFFSSSSERDRAFRRMSRMIASKKNPPPLSRDRLNHREIFRRVRRGRHSRPTRPDPTDPPALECRSFLRGHDLPPPGRCRRREESAFPTVDLRGQRCPGPGDSGEHYNKRSPTFEYFADCLVGFYA